MMTLHGRPRTHRYGHDSSLAVRGVHARSAVAEPAPLGAA